jgi:hypothetical protein
MDAGQSPLDVRQAYLLKQYGFECKCRKVFTAHMQQRQKHMRLRHTWM